MKFSEAQQAVTNFSTEEVDGSQFIVLTHVAGTTWKAENANTGNLLRFVLDNDALGNVVVAYTEDQPVKGSKKAAAVVADGGSIKVGRWTYPTGRKAGGNTIYRQMRDGEWTVVN